MLFSISDLEFGISSGDCHASLAMTCGGLPKISVVRPFRVVHEAKVTRKASHYISNRFLSLRGVV